MVNQDLQVSREKLDHLGLLVYLEHQDRKDRKEILVKVNVTGYIATYYNILGDKGSKGQKGNSGRRGKTGKPGFPGPQDLLAVFVKQNLF